MVIRNKRKLKKELLQRMGRRNFVIAGGQSVLGLLLAGRLYQLQIAQNEGWQFKTYTCATFNGNRSNR